MPDPTEARSLPDRSCSATASGPFLGSDAKTLRCGDIDGHDGPHYFHVEWGDTSRGMRWIDSTPSRCEHRDDSTHDGRWCGFCNPEFGGDRGAGI